ncbi:MAG: licC domain protein [Muribaculaceae bacterium]|nr:licC domain protein [Muribaculaceae bacterium]
MRTLIVTVAGTATRFNRDTDEPALKCLYNIGGAKNTLLYQILSKASDFDEFIIVGGYLYGKLEAFVNSELGEFRDRIKLVFNPEYSTFGSGYSLILGIQNSNPQSDEVIFVEGDLYFDNTDFERIKQSEKNVFTVNHEPITAKKAVVVYENEEGYLRYLYDTSHSYLRITEPFLAVYNSGQVWKFMDIVKLFRVVSELSAEQTKGTNLEIIQGYFGDLKPDQYEMVEFSVWHNCNTVKDYETVYSRIKA